MNSDPRDAVRDALSRYAAIAPEQADVVRRMLALIDEHEDCLHRTCRVGHITASALILSPDRTACLLTHHRKLERWLQLGGHVDGEGRPHLSALREAREESGMERFSFLDAADAGDADPLPFDVDVHVIPARRDEPAHEHHDIRYLIVADAGQELQISDESNELRWFPLDEVAAGLVNSDDSVSRLARKAQSRLQACDR